MICSNTSVDHPPAMASIQTLLQQLLLLLLLLLTHSFLSSADDAAVMTKLGGALHPTPDGWSSSEPYCTWNGVKCGSSGRVVVIDLSFQSLSGTLPPELTQLSELERLDIQRNSLSGPLPSLANMSNLREVYLDFNEFDSVPGNFLLGLPSLRILTISSNFKLPGWEIPAYIQESSKLLTFNASFTSILGVIPDIFGSLGNLRNLILSYNYLTGPLPPTLRYSVIENLLLNGQVSGLSGTLDVLASMTQLYQVWLHSNSFTGPIPDLSKFENLFDLQLRDNQLTGIVPQSLMDLPNLVNISLQNNKLQGPMPQFRDGVDVTLSTNSFCRTTPGPCDPQVSALLDVAGAIGYPMPLAESWQGNDACQEWRSVTCDTQGKHVISVNFGKQQLSGTISPAFANLTSLRSLFLNDNNLTGAIPESLTTLAQLQVLNVSNNNLSGPMPLFRTSVNFNHSGNPLLGKTGSDGGGGRSGGGSGSESNSGTRGGSSSQSSNGSSVSGGTIAGVVISVLVFIGVVLFVSYRCYMKRRHRRFGRVEGSEQGKEMEKTSVIPSVNGYAGVPSELRSQSRGDPSEIPIFEGGNVAISIQVLRQVTNNFSEENVLGRGGFGVVYKGELHNGTKIAVKRMESGAMGTKGMHEFQAEITVLTKVRHRHLVALLGYCANDNERLLVYEYMPEGTLSQHLFQWQERGYPPLTWKQRVTIALDVARGVEYLHRLAQQSFIHRDLKSSNILLGDDMRAKVADFGLVRNAPDGQSSVETRVAGTFGYLAPEYATTGRVTTKVDVFSFGVVLMEIVTGRKALDGTSTGEIFHLGTWFHGVLVNKDNLREAIDPILDLDDETYESICQVAELAGHCNAHQAFKRPDMGHVVKVLGPLVEKWLPPNHTEEDSCSIDLDTSLSEALQSEPTLTISTTLNLRQQSRTRNTI